MKGGACNFVPNRTSRIDLHSSFSLNFVLVCLFVTFLLLFAFSLPPISWIETLDVKKMLHFLFKLPMFKKKIRKTPLSFNAMPLDDWFTANSVRTAEFSEAASPKNDARITKQNHPAYVCQEGKFTSCKREISIPLNVLLVKSCASLGYWDGSTCKRRSSFEKTCQIKGSGMHLRIFPTFGQLACIYRMGRPFEWPVLPLRRTGAWHYARIAVRNPGLAVFPYPGLCELISRLVFPFVLHSLVVIPSCANNGCRPQNLSK